MFSISKLLIQISLYFLRFLPPEVSSLISLKTIKYLKFFGVKLNKIRKESLQQKTNYNGLTFNHIIGLSAGIDKEGKYFHSLGSLGFSFVEVGTFTPKPQKGNNYPRIKRLENNSLINRLGFNNPGILNGIKNISRYKNNFSGVLGISIGKNKDTTLDDAYKDYIYCIDHCFNFADYIAVNISSPNTKDLRKLSSSDYIEDLTKEINIKKRHLEEHHGKKVPLLLKISPDETENNLEKILSTSLSNGFAGFIVSNTMQGNFKGISGGVSGELLKERSSYTLKKVSEYLDKETLIIASGGISTKSDVEERLDNGAKLIQVYTSFIYQGPSIINDLLN